MRDQLPQLCTFICWYYQTHLQWSSWKHWVFQDFQHHILEVTKLRLISSYFMPYYSLIDTVSKALLSWAAATLGLSAILGMLDGSSPYSLDAQNTDGSGLGLGCKAPHVQVWWVAQVYTAWMKKWIQWGLALHSSAHVTFLSLVFSHWVQVPCCPMPIIIFCFLKYFSIQFQNKYIYLNCLVDVSSSAGLSSCPPFCVDLTTPMKVISGVSCWAC